MGSGCSILVEYGLSHHLPTGSCSRYIITCYGSVSLSPTEYNRRRGKNCIPRGRESLEIIEPYYDRFKRKIHRVFLSLDREIIEWSWSSFPWISTIQKNIIIMRMKQRVNQPYKRKMIKGEINRGSSVLSRIGKLSFEHGVNELGTGFISFAV